VTALYLGTAFPLLGHGHDGIVYLVLDCQADLKSLVADLLSGQYRRPLRVVAFNAETGCIQDVSAEIARELLCCEDELEMPPTVREFVERAGLKPRWGGL
jgi:hypothetical protein